MQAFGIIFISSTENDETFFRRLFLIALPATRFSSFSFHRDNDEE